MKGYINILQGKIARYEQGITPTECQGFFTDGISSCSFLVFSGKKNGTRRISAFHSDGHLLNMSPQAILAEKEWVGDLDHCCLFRDPHYDSDTPHPIVGFFHDNQISYTEIFLDVDECDESELSITFSETLRRGYRFKGYSHHSFHKTIINHPDAVRMYAFYTLNINLLEIQSTQLFNQLVIADPTLLRQWESYKISFAKRRKMTRNDTSNLDYNPIIFDGRHFTTPGLHDISLTPYALQFSNRIDEQSLHPEDLHHNMLLHTMSKQQLAVINLMHDESRFSNLGNGPAYSDAINKSEIVAALDGFIKSNFDISSIKSEFAKYYFVRYSLQHPVPLVNTPLNSNTNIPRP